MFSGEGNCVLRFALGEMKGRYFPKPFTCAKLSFPTKINQQMDSSFALHASSFPGNQRCLFYGEFPPASFKNIYIK